MTKNEIMYDYAKIEYENALNRKNDLRTRSATFFGIGFTIISAVTTISFSATTESFSTTKIVLLIISLLFFMSSLILFLIIFSPSSQETYSTKDIISDLRNIESAEENHTLIQYYQKRNEFKYIVSELSFAYSSERLAEITEWYNKKIRFFMKCFIVMSITLITSLVLLVITISV